MDKRFENGEWREPSVLPPHLRRLHRLQMKAIRAERGYPDPPPKLVVPVKPLAETPLADFFRK